MSNLSNIPDGGDLPDRYRNVGEQIQAFFDFAENNPDRAVPFFVNIWETQASLTTRALALQGLGVAAKHYRVKEAFANWDVLKDIAKEVKGKGEVSNDLTRWAAASALEAIGYSRQSLENLQGGGFTEPLDRIRREIRDRKFIEINRIQRLNSRGETTAEYERHLEFWLYGPADELLNDNDRSLNYQDLIGDVISKLHGRGVYLGLISPNGIVQEAALRQAELIFKESAEIEDFIYGLLEEFLHNSNNETSLRIKAAEIINTATDVNRRLKNLSKLLLEERNPKLHEVALRQAQSAFHHYAEDFIYGLLEEFLDNSNNEIALRIYAAEIINTTTDLSRRLKTLSQLLLEKIELRNAAVRLLTPYKQELTRVEPDANTVLDALIFEYQLNKAEPKDLTISQLETYFSSASQYHREVSEIFTSAIAASESLARRYGGAVSVLKQFLQNKQHEYLSDIESWLQVLTNQISETEAEQRKVQSNQPLIKEAIDFLGRPIPENVCVSDAEFVIYSTEFHTYNQSYKIQRDLKSIKVYLLEFIKKDEYLQRFLNTIVSSKPGLDDFFKTLSELSNNDLNFTEDLNFTIHDGLGDKRTLLFVLYFAIVIGGAVYYRWEWFVVILIFIVTIVVAIIIKFPFVVREREEKEKRIKHLRSILYKLNTQWKE